MSGDPWCPIHNFDLCNCFCYQGYKPLEPYYQQYNFLSHDYEQHFKHIKEEVDKELFMVMELIACNESLILFCKNIRDAVIEEARIQEIVRRIKS